MKAIDLIREQSLLEAFKGGDKIAGAALLDMHAGSIFRTAIKFQRTNVPLDDILQEARMGFLHHALSYRYDGGKKLYTYAKWGSLAYIRNYLAEMAYPVAVSSSDQDAVYAACKAQASTPGWADTPTSLDAPMYTNSSHEGRETLGDMLCDSTNDAETQLIDAQSRGLLDQWLDELTPRERSIIEAHILNPEKENLERIAPRFGVTRERVRQIEARAIRKLQTMRKMHDMSSKPNPRKK